MLGYNPHKPGRPSHAYHSYQLSGLRLLLADVLAGNAVLVTDLKHDLLTISQLYRDRADSENTFDELKHQWGWGGFTPPTPVNCCF